MRYITICPSCGSQNIKRVQQDWADEFCGQPYLVPDLEFYECPDCGERLCDRETMRKIEAHSPAFAKVSKKTKTRIATGI